MEVFTSFIQLGFENVVENGSLLMLPAMIYAVLATLLALMLGWGRILFQEVDGTLVLKLPGGGLLGSAPLPEMSLLGFVLMANSSLNPGMMLLALGLQFFVVLRFELAALTHVLTFAGSMIAYSKGLKFSVECMDGRCTHGTRSGNFLHYWACGGFTLLTALGFAPFIIFPVFLGLPDGVLGIVVLAICSLPYPFVIAKLLAPKFSDETQKLVKGLVDVWMFFTEVTGWALGCVTMSIAAFRFMWPGISPTSLHAKKA